jgi:hypothetical protein
MDFHPIELLHWWETRTNRARPREQSLTELTRAWSRGGADAFPDASQAAWGAGRAEASNEPELMIVLTTYARPGGAARVLEQLQEALAAASLTEQAALLVLHDACGRDYGAVREGAAGVCSRLLWLDARQRFGKAGFWKMHQTALSVAAAWRPRLTLYLQDDIELEPDFVLRALELWRATAHDPLRRVLYLFSSSDDETHGRWIQFEREDRGSCRLTNWFDLQAFLVDRAFFELLEYRMVPIHPNRWLRQPRLSSGVGQQLTVRLFGRAQVYQAWPPLVVHGAAPSTMNPEARALRTLDNRADFIPSRRPRTA